MPQTDKAGNQQTPGRLNGKFAPGVSGNPAGRKEGSRSKATLAMQDILLTEGEAVIRRAVDLAIQGNEVALKLVIERLIPVSKDRVISLELPKIVNPSDVAEAVKRAVEAVSDGEMTPGEGETILKLLAALRTALSGKPGDLQSEAFAGICGF